MTRNGEPTYIIFPSNYAVYRKDRNSHGGGVFIAVKDIYPSYPLYPSTANCEIVWASLEPHHHSTDHLIRILRQWINFVTLSTKYSRILLLIIHKC